jgi:hypothetical protein
MTLRQDVPLCKDTKGNDLFITLNFLRDLRRALSDSTTTTDPDTDDVDALTVVVNGVIADLSALEARVRKLEGGYQS